MSSVRTPNPAPESHDIGQLVQTTIRECWQTIEAKHKTARDQHFNDNPGLTAPEIRKFFEDDLAQIQKEKANIETVIHAGALQAIDKAYDEATKEINERHKYMGLPHLWKILTGKPTKNEPDDQKQHPKEKSAAVNKQSKEASLLTAQSVFSAKSTSSEPGLIEPLSPVSPSGNRK